MPLNGFPSRVSVLICEPLPLTWIDNPVWSSDSLSIYYHSFMEPDLPIYKLDVQTHNQEKIFQLRDMQVSDAADYRFKGFPRMDCRFFRFTCGRRMSIRSPGSTTSYKQWYQPDGTVAAGSVHRRPTIASIAEVSESLTASTRCRLLSAALVASRRASHARGSGKFCPFPGHPQSRCSTSSPTGA